jgi:hypothetical protein
LLDGFQYSYGQNGFRIKTLVTERVAYDTTSDNFIRRFVLVMLGTVLALTSHDYVPMSYYEFLRDIREMRKTSWNMFTLNFSKASLTKFKEGSKDSSSLPSHGHLATLLFFRFETRNHQSGEEY